MKVHTKLRTLVAQHGQRVVVDSETLRGLLDDYLDESEISPGQINALVDAVRLHAFERLLVLVERGADPEQAVSAVGEELARERSGDTRSSMWACATLGYAVGAVPERVVLIHGESVAQLAPPPDPGLRIPPHPGPFPPFPSPTPQPARGRSVTIVIALVVALLLLGGVAAAGVWVLVRDEGSIEDFCTSFEAVEAEEELSANQFLTEVDSIVDNAPSVLEEDADVLADGRDQLREAFEAVDTDVDLDTAISDLSESDGATLEQAVADSGFDEETFDQAAGNMRTWAEEHCAAGR